MPKPTTPKYSIAALDASNDEGDSGTTPFTFTVTRTAGNGAATVNYAVTGAQADDFAGGVIPSGTVNFAKGDLSEEVTILVAGDALVETDENFTVTLSGSKKVQIDPLHASATGTIQDDDDIGNGFLGSDVTVSQNVDNPTPFSWGTKTVSEAVVEFTEVDFYKFTIDVTDDQVLFESDMTRAPINHTELWRYTFEGDVDDIQDFVLDTNIVGLTAGDITVMNSDVHSGISEIFVNMTGTAWAPDSYFTVTADFIA